MSLNQPPDLTAMGDEELVAHLAAIDAADDERVARLSAPDALLVAARWYADAAGWPVFPCQPRGKQPITRNGFKDATTDLEQIERWWTTTPDANIGTPTGHSFDVVDIDGAPGYGSLADMREAGILPDVLAKSLTPRGLHLLIEPTGDGNSAAMLPGIDYRGVGGYIILPPSVGVNSRRYDWSEPVDLTRFGAHAHG